MGPAMQDSSNAARSTPSAALGLGRSRFLSGSFAPPPPPSAPVPKAPKARAVACPEPPPQHTHRTVLGQMDLEAQDELQAVPAFAELSREVIAELTMSSTQRRVHAGVTIIEQGSAAPHLEVLARGAVKSVRTTKHALGESTVVLEVSRAPALVLGASFFDGQPEPASVVTLRASQIITLDRRVVSRLMNAHPSVGRALMGHFAQSVRRHVRRVDEVTSGPVDDRVRHLLEGLAADYGTPFGQGRFIAIPLRRKDIACMVNATTETVSRVLARFEREGITRSTRDGIWLKLGTATVPPPPPGEEVLEPPPSALRAR
jgi:CRP-like cAMP-binding protein